MPFSYVAMINLNVLTHFDNTSWMDRHSDRRTNRQTDKQTIPIALRGLGFVDT